MTLDAEVQSLREVPFFKGVDPARLKLLAFTSDRLRFAPGELFFQQGDPSDAAFVILDGAADVRLATSAGEITVAQLGRSALLGEMGILCEAPRSATVAAATATTALRIDRRVFFELLNQFPQMSIAILRELARRLEQTNEQLVAARSSP